MFSFTVLHIAATSYSLKFYMNLVQATIQINFELLMQQIAKENHAKKVVG